MSNASKRLEEIEEQRKQWSAELKHTEDERKQLGDPPYTAPGAAQKVEDLYFAEERIQKDIKRIDKEQHDLEPIVYQEIFEATRDRLGAYDRKLAEGTVDTVANQANEADLSKKMAEQKIENEQKAIDLAEERLTPEGKSYLVGQVEAYQAMNSPVSLPEHQTNVCTVVEQPSPEVRPTPNAQPDLVMAALGVGGVLLSIAPLAAQAVHAYSDKITEFTDKAVDTLRVFASDERSGGGHDLKQDVADLRETDELKKQQAKEKEDLLARQKDAKEEFNDRMERTKPSEEKREQYEKTLDKNQETEREKLAEKHERHLERLREEQEKERQGHLRDQDEQQRHH